LSIKKKLDTIESPPTILQIWKFWNFLVERQNDQLLKTLTHTHTYGGGTDVRTSIIMSDVIFSIFLSVELEFLDRSFEIQQHILSS
jgi:hypothetical protein